jgi:hypothetical protein
MQNLNNLSTTKKTPTHHNEQTKSVSHLYYKKSKKSQKKSQNRPKTNPPVHSLRAMSCDTARIA